MRGKVRGYHKLVRRLWETIRTAWISRTYSAFGGSMTGLELLMFAMDHTTHHRASAEMYLRARGIKPPDYQF